MAKDGTVNLMACLRRAVLAGDMASRTDGQLLEDYLSRRDEAAVAALVRRHGPMVWGVCRRVLLNHHDAEDAFQATFLVLVRRAASVVPREMVGNWLYGVAHQTALKARATAAKRRGRERQVTEMPEPAARPEPDLWDDLGPLLDQELSRLPDKYRVAVVLCDLEGKTRKEAARQLQIPEGTLSTRLRTARAMLAKRLARHGLAVSGGALAAVLLQKAGSAGVPTSVACPTIKAVTLVAAGQAAAGVISVRVAALTNGVVKGMVLTKLSAVIGVVLIVGFMATGTTILARRTAVGQEDKKATAGKPMEPAAKKEKEPVAFTAWGKEVGLLQAGLGFRPGERRAYHYGETVTLVVRVRNVGKKEVEFQYLKAFFEENPPLVTDADGKKLPGYKILYTPLAHLPEEMSLAPGKEIELSSERYQLLPAKDRGKGHSGRFQPLWVGTGKVSVQYERLFGNTSAGRIKVDPDLLDLATGKLELEIKEATTETPQAQSEKQGQESRGGPREGNEATGKEEQRSVAWGTVRKGLQAGVRLVAPEGKVRQGDYLTVEFVVRNVSKEDVTVEYIQPTGWGCSVDKPGRLVFGSAYSGGRPIIYEKTLRPGQTWDVTQITMLTRRPTSREGINLWTPLKPGKYRLSCPGVLPGAVPALRENRLPTGDLEIEIVRPKKGERGKEEKPQRETGATGVDPATRTR